jgi:glyoxylase-like metal-dependent hydrolase (beta-lactamase superfamily II)
VARGILAKVTKAPPPFEVESILHPSGCRSYVVVEPESRDALVVDPLLDRVGETLRLVAGKRAALRWVVDTHSHGDHLSGAAVLHARTGADVVMSVAADTKVATRRVADGDSLPLGERVVRVRATPGVAPDAIVLVGEGGTPLAFTGDTLLVGTMGRKDVPGSDPLAHYESLQRVLEVLPDETVVHPGHDDMGRDRTTMKAERRGNRWIREKDRDAYVARWNADPRTTPREAAEILAANREGTANPPAEALEAVEKVASRPKEGAGGAAAVGSGMQTPSAMRSADRGAAVPEGMGQLLAAIGAAVVGSTALGALVHPVFHLVAGAVGVLALGLGLVATLKRRPKPSSGLYYLGPLPRTPSR